MLVSSFLDPVRGLGTHAQSRFGNEYDDATLERIDSLDDLPELGLAFGFVERGDEERRRLEWAHVSRTVDTTMVQAYWLIGREIVEVEQGT